MNLSIYIQRRPGTWQPSKFSTEVGKQEPDSVPSHRPHSPTIESAQIQLHQAVGENRAIYSQTALSPDVTAQQVLSNAW